MKIDDQRESIADIPQCDDAAQPIALSRGGGMTATLHRLKPRRLTIEQARLISRNDHLGWDDDVLAEALALTTKAPFVNIEDVCAMNDQVPQPPHTPIQSPQGLADARDDAAALYQTRWHALLPVTIVLAAGGTCMLAAVLLLRFYGAAL